MNDRFLRACRREPVDRTPLWIMRQAGRYLPEYRALRERVSFLDLCRTPELAVEASLMPIRRFDLDAAILFSDIFVPVAAMGVPVTFEPGPTFARPIRTRDDVRALQVPKMAKAVPFVGEAVAMLARELAGQKPLIGFCGAPFTLAAYLVEGRSGEGFDQIQSLMFREPATLRELLDKLADAMADYLKLQIDSGAQAVQLFDTWAGLLSPDEYRVFALPAVRRILERLGEPRVPVIYFALAAPHLVELAASSGADVLSVCWRVPLDEARRRTGGRVALQGNLHPHALLAGPEVTRARALEVLASAGDQPGHILNLGHGILPTTPIESVEALIQVVRERGGATNPTNGGKSASAAKPAEATEAV
jgi:uroporphyrinogen decarboxylase